MVENGGDLHGVDGLHEEAGDGRNPSGPAALHCADLGCRHDWVGDRVVVAAEMDRVNFPGPEEQVPVHLDRSARVRCSEALVRVHRAVGVLGWPQALVEF